MFSYKINSSVLRSSIAVTTFFILLVSTTAVSQLLGGKNILTGTWNGEEVEYWDREIIIGLAAGIVPDDVDSLLDQNNATVVEEFDRLNIALLEIPSEADLFQTIEVFEQDPLIKYAEPNLVDRIIQTNPNDPYYVGASPATYPHQWALNNTGQNPPNGTVDADIDAPEAWDFETGSSSVLVAILDSGIPMQSGVLSHPDLNDPDKFILGPDFVGDGYGVKDECGHGTHVAGIVSAETNNDTGVAGVSWNSQILVIQVFGQYGDGSHQRFKNGVFAAVDSGAQIINYSGGGSHSETKEQAVHYADSMGVFQSYSAGNGGSDGVVYPARYAFWGDLDPQHQNGYESVISVAATQYDDERASYSSYEPSGVEISVAAPGGAHDGGYPVDSGDIFSTMPNYSVTLNGYPYYASQTYGYLPGTSMAAPHVSGLAALLLSRFPSYSAPQIRYAIEQTAEDVNSSTYPGRDKYLGWGRINANQAINYYTRSGIISSDETWSIWVLVVGDVTVSNGVTLTIEPSTTVEFTENTKLQINGILNARGAEGSDNVIFTASDPTKPWQGIVFADSSDDALCVMKNCYIEYANSGITFSGASPDTIENILIAHCNYGIYCENSSPRISSLTIGAAGTVPVGISCVGNSAARIDSVKLSGNGAEYSKGIHIENSDPVIRDGTIWNFERGINICGGDPDIRDVTLTYNTECGIACNWPKDQTKEESCDPCSAYIAYNYISHNQIGIKSKSAFPTIFRNRIFQNDTSGVQCSGTITPNLGVDGAENSGYNEIFNYKWNVYSECAGTVKAEKNWWCHVNSDTIANKLYGSISYIPYLFQSPDSIPPSEITDLTATLVDTCIYLEWTAVNTDTTWKEDPVYYYVVYRDTTAGFFPTSLESISAIETTGYVDCNSGVVNNTSLNYYYAIRAVDYGYNYSSASNQVGEFDKYLSETGEDPFP